MVVDEESLGFGLLIGQKMQFEDVILDFCAKKFLNNRLIN